MQTFFTVNPDGLIRTVRNFMRDSFGYTLREQIAYTEGMVVHGGSYGEPTRVHVSSVICADSQVMDVIRDYCGDLVGPQL